MRVMYKYRFQRHRADGSHNETTSMASFVKWFKDGELAETDTFFVGKTDWVEVTHDGKTTAGDPHVSKLDDVVCLSRQDAMPRKVAKKK